MCRAIGSSKVTTTHTFESPVNRLKISKNRNYKTLSILEFPTNETNSPMRM